MVSFSDLPGKIKRIESSISTKKNISIRVVEGIIIDYIYDSKAKGSMKHKLECVTLDGNSSVIYINENSCISDIDVDKNTKECLMSIRSSILRKREATKIIYLERANIEELITKLLCGVNAISREEFIRILTSKLDKHNGYHLSKYHNNYILDIRLNSIEVSFSIKKHYLSDIKIRGTIDTKNTCNEIEEIKDIDVFVHKKEFVNKKSKSKFLDKYGVSKIFNKEYYDFIKSNNLELNDSSYCGCGHTEIIKYKISHTISKHNDKLFLNNDNIDMIISLIDVLKK